MEAELNVAREGPAVLQLEDGSVLVLGGRGVDVKGSVESCTGTGSPWQLRPEMTLHHADQEYRAVLIDL